jgi:ketosteroid isomerase-like protein
MLSDWVHGTREKQLFVAVRNKNIDTVGDLSEQDAMFVDLIQDNNLKGLQQFQAKKIFDCKKNDL